MADARPTLPHWRSDIRKRKQTQFSRPMTGHTPQKLPRFRAISCIIAVRVLCFREKFANSPYTRSIMIPPFFLFVKHNFLYFSNYFFVFITISASNCIQKSVPIPALYIVGQCPISLQKTAVFLRALRHIVVPLHTVSVSNFHNLCKPFLAQFRITAF